jgi:hypothetical protein
MTTDTSSKKDNDLTAESLDRLTQTRLPELSRNQFSEAVEHPAHYGGDTTYEAIKVVQAWGLGFELGSALKYICRAGKKPDEPYLKDLEKARYYIQAEIDRVNAVGGF